MSPTISRCSRRAALLAAFAFAAQMRAAPQGDVSASQMREFGDAEPRLDGQQEQDAIASADPGGDVRRREDGLDFGSCQVRDRSSLVPLDRNGQDLAAAIEMRRLADGHVSTEGVDRGEPDIARARRVPTVLLDMIQKRTDKRRVEIIEGECRGFFAEALLCETQEEAKRIAIRRDGMRTRALLADEALGKEAL